MTLNEGPDSTFGATTHERRKDDSRTLKTVIPEMEALIGNITERLLGDKGCRGHNAPPGYKFRVFISGQKRRVTPKINASCAGAPPSNRSSAISNPSIAWGATTCGTARLMPPMPSSPQPATTSGFSSAGWSSVAPVPRPAHGPTSIRPRLKSAFFTADYFQTVLFERREQRMRWAASRRTEQLAAADRPRPV